VALQFNLKPENLAQIRESFIIIDVKYLTDFPKINYYRTETVDLLDGVFGSKAKAWAHESEWRIVLQDGTGHVKAPPTIIDGVIFGLKTPPDYEAEIRDWISQRSTPTELFRVRHRPFSFDLEIVRA
jgi:hypothetical protein